MSNFGYIRDPFKGFEKKTKLGALKTKCVGCDGCKYELNSHMSTPCCLCSHNMRNKTNASAKNYYQKARK